MAARGLPGPWDHEPPIPPSGIVAYTAFWALQGDRNNGIGVGPIRWTAIDAYAVRHGIEGDAFLDFEHYLTTMDNLYLQRSREKGEGKESESTGGNRQLTPGGPMSSLERET